MAWKASEAKLVKSKYLVGAIIFGAMVPYLLIFLNHLANSHNEGGKVLAQCMGVKDALEMNKSHLLVTLIVNIFLIGSGLFFDIKMLLFVRNRNKIEPSQFVPWKSVGSKEKENDDATVPLRASYVSTASLIFFGILAPMYLVLANQMGKFLLNPN